MDIGDGSTTMGGGGPPLLLVLHGCDGCGGGGGGGGGCRFNRECMLSASGKADMPGSDGADGDALFDPLQPEEPSDEHDELFLDCDTGDGVPSV